MDTTRTTVPGTLHHLRTRGGHRFRARVDDAGRLSRSVYGLADVPSQRILMGRDAGQVTDVLQVPVADRVAHLEQRFAALTGGAP